MAERLALILLFASYLLVSEVMSKNITIENKCDYTVWPGIFTSEGPLLNTTGFTLKKGEMRAIEAVAYWSGKIWGRTLCSINSIGKFSCATGDCGSGEIKCFGYPKATTLTEFKIHSYKDSLDSYRVNLVYGFNLPLQVVPQRSIMTGQCTVVGCDVVDLNKACPYELMVVDEEEQPIACTSFSQIFKNACPTSIFESSEYNYFACPNSTDYIITFCPSYTPIPTR